MHKIRILIVTHAPLSPKYGAGQMAINLAEAFKKQGHEVTHWSPHPMPNFTRWWQYLETLPLMRSRLDSFLSEQEPFDVIDCAGVLITNSVVTKSKLTVARSVQPDISYLASGLLDGKGIKKIILLPFNLFSALVHIFLLLQGWSRTTYILCLGSLELKMINIPSRQGRPGAREKQPAGRSASGRSWESVHNAGNFPVIPKNRV